ncbi:MAG: cupin domain-containing protein [Candidatus Micrarchaeota archaeon]|nr:cupin domain-containing protein [Candidatus Micrarchaeota archaeon]
MSNYEVKNISGSEEVRELGRAKLESVNVGGAKVARFVLGKGWKWSVDIKPLVKTEWCEASHFQYQISGKLHIKLKDGTEFEIGPGDVSSVPSGHDAWVVGDEPVVGIEWTATEIVNELSKGDKD